MYKLMVLAIEKLFDSGWDPYMLQKKIIVPCPHEAAGDAGAGATGVAPQDVAAGAGAGGGTAAAGAAAQDAAAGAGAGGGAAAGVVLT